MLGPDDEVGLLATADTPLNALNAQSDALLARLSIGDKNDFIVKHVKSLIVNASRTEKVQRLVNQLGEG